MKKLLIEFVNENDDDDDYNDNDNDNPGDNKTVKV